MAPSSLNCLPALQPGRAPMPQLSSVSHPSWPGSPAPGPVQTASAAAGGSLLRACPWPPQRLGRPKRSKVRTGRIDSAWNRWRRNQEWECCGNMAWSLEARCGWHPIHSFDSPAVVDTHHQNTQLGACWSLLFFPLCSFFWFDHTSREPCFCSQLNKHLISITV